MKIEVEGETRLKLVPETDFEKEIIKWWGRRRYHHEIPREQSIEISGNAIIVELKEAKDES